MKDYDWMMLFAVLASPFLAVFVQKRIEEWRGKKFRQAGIFKTLMATRAARLSFEHVQALNMIDLEFAGSTKSEQDIRRIWREYLDHLCSLSFDPKLAESQLPSWEAKCADYFADLLEAMGKCCGYNFDKVYLRKSFYSPAGHAQVDNEQRAMRVLLLEILKGDRRIPMEVVLKPGDDAAAKFVKEYQKSLLDLLKGKSELRVNVADGPTHDIT